MSNSEDYFNSLPKILDPILLMDNPNEDLNFLSGDFTIKWKEKEINLTGDIIFKWVPNMAVKFYGEFEKSLNGSIIELWKKPITFEIEAREKNFYAKGGTQRINIGNKNNIVCILVAPITFGNLGKEVNCVRFEVPNLRDFHGIAVKKESTGYKNRLIFKNNEFTITLDKYIDYIELHQELKEIGGFALLYTGQLELNDANYFSYDRATEALNSFSYFLQFINGRRTAPIFRYGLSDNIEQWKSITPYLVDKYKHTTSWSSGINIEGLSEAWCNFSGVWENESDRECIKTVLHWYVEANSNTAFIEGSIVLIQNSLELLFHWLIAEKLKYVNPNDADNISAAGKIGFLLSSNNISSQIPSEFGDLLKFAKQNNLVNGPETFIRIRNCIVHPSVRKRKTLKEIEGKAKYQALSLGIWYVEVILLKKLNFKGEYHNRCKAYGLHGSSDKIE